MFLSKLQARRYRNTLYHHIRQIEEQISTMSDMLSDVMIAQMQDDRNNSIKDFDAISEYLGESTWVMLCR